MSESKIKTVTMFEATDGTQYSSMASAKNRQHEIEMAERANVLLDEGKSVGEILESVCRIVHDDILFKVTKHSRLSIPHWQCRDEPGYQPQRFKAGMFIHVSGHAGSWTGPYGNWMTISDLARYAANRNSELEPNARSAQEAHGESETNQEGGVA